MFSLLALAATPSKRIIRQLHCSPFIISGLCARRHASRAAALSGARFSTVGAKLKDSWARGWLAERGREVVASVFLNDFAPVAAVGPLTVHPRHEGGVGRALMETAFDHARSRGFEGMRLVQSPSLNPTSFSLAVLHVRLRDQGRRLSRVRGAARPIPIAVLTPHLRGGSGRLR